MKILSIKFSCFSIKWRSRFINECIAIHKFVNEDWLYNKIIKEMGFIWYFSSRKYITGIREIYGTVIRCEIESTNPKLKASCLVDWTDKLMDGNGLADSQVSHFHASDRFRYIWRLMRLSRETPEKRKREGWLRYMQTETFFLMRVDLPYSDSPFSRSYQAQLLN